MKRLNDLSFVDIDGGDPDWLGVCAAGALLINRWKIIRANKDEMLPTGNIEVAGGRLEAEFWWAALAGSAERVPPQSASQLVIAVRPTGDMAAPRSLVDDLRNKLAREIERLKTGTVADLPFDAGPDQIEI